MKSTLFAKLALACWTFTQSAFADPFEEAALKELRTSSRFTVPAGHEPFVQSADYPPEMPPAEDYPWLKVDFRSDPTAYMRAVLAYVTEGNVEVDWKVQDNAVRKWYHAPWMHFAANGREPIHGLTSERTSRPLELHEAQKKSARNWAVGFYNAPGGYTIGQVWKSPTQPNAQAARFPVGTVSAKLLFTEADETLVPYLKGSKEWWAAIDRDGKPPTRMRLLQLDVAIRDERANETTGWVFGTFIYLGDEPGENAFDRLVPVGLAWGNDPQLTKEAFEKGARPTEGWLNPRVEAMFASLPRKSLGFRGRVNGPVDNPRSSCISCHSMAMDNGQFAGTLEMIPRAGSGEYRVGLWFRNRKPDQAFIRGRYSLDYSLQLAAGIDAFREWSYKNFGDRVTDLYPTRREPNVVPTLRSKYPLMAAAPPRDFISSFRRSEAPVTAPTLPSEAITGIAPSQPPSIIPATMPRVCCCATAPRQTTFFPRRLFIGRIINRCR
jgi:hypothetical protein